MISIGSWNKLSRWHLHHHCWERRCQHRQSIVSYMDSACADSGTLNLIYPQQLKPAVKYFRTSSFSWMPAGSWPKYRCSIIMCMNELNLLTNGQNFILDWKWIKWSMVKTAEEGKTTLEKMLANFVTFVEGWWASSNYMFMRYVVFILHAIQTKSKEKYVILIAGWMCVNILTCARLKCHLIDLLCWQKCCHFHLSVHQCHVVWVFLLNSPTVQACIDQYYS